MDSEAERRCDCGHLWSDHDSKGYPWTGDRCEKCQRYCNG